MARLSPAQCSLTVHNCGLKHHAYIVTSISTNDDDDDDTTTTPTITTTTTTNNNNSDNNNANDCKDNEKDNSNVHNGIYSNEIVKTKLK